jgi:hypothetical protein
MIWIGCWNGLFVITFTPQPTLVLWSGASWCCGSIILLYLLYIKAEPLCCLLIALVTVQVHMNSTIWKLLHEPILEKVCIISFMLRKHYCIIYAIFSKNMVPPQMCHLCYYHLLSEKIMQSSYTVPLQKYTTILEKYICSTVCLFQPRRILLPYSVATPNKKRFHIHCLFTTKIIMRSLRYLLEKIKLHHHINVLINSFKWTWTSTSSFSRKKYNCLLLKQI